jgi:hypothetical protein
MAYVIHKTQRDAAGALLQLASVHTPDYQTGDWLINPDLSGVSGVAKKYWKVVGVNVTEMNTSEKTAVDAAELAAAKAQRKTDLLQEGWDYIEGRYEDGTQRMLLVLYSETYVNAKTNRRAHIGDWLEWMEGCAAHIRSKIDSVTSQTTVEDVNAVALNTSAMDGLDPLVTLGNTLDHTD